MAPEVDAINGLLRTELTAIEAYDEVLARLGGLRFTRDLRAIRYAHETAADALRIHIRNLGGEPVEHTEAAVRLHSGAAAVGSPDRTLGELRRIEESGITAYEQVLQREQMPDECRFAIRVELLARCHDHMDALAGMAAALAQES
jgi:hypothetical protein